MSGTTQDFRYAFRTLAKRPGFTVAAILTLALGIGAATTVYSWYDRVVRQTWPGVLDGSRLLSFQSLLEDGGRTSLSYPELLDYQDRAESVEGIVAVDVLPLSVVFRGEPERAWSQLVSANYFDVLGVNPILGRGFTSNESLPGGSAATVLSFDYWQRRFGGDPGIVGASITLNTTRFTVVGVAPRGFKGSDFGLSFDLWVPLTMVGEFGAPPDLLERRDWFWLDGFARLAPGVTRQQAESELIAIAASLGEEFPDTNRGRTVRLLPTSRDSGSGAAMLLPILGVLGLFAALLLLLACANVANLQLSRAVERRREISLRLASGATRGRLVRQLLIESLVVAGGGGAAGLAFAWLARRSLLLFAPPSDMPVGMEIPIAATTVAFAAAAAAVTAVVFGLVPALQASKADLAAMLREDVTSTGGRSRSRLARGIVIAQVTLSVVLLVISGLFLRSYRAARHLDVGFRPTGVLLASFDLEHRSYSEDEVRAFHRRLDERLASMRGVESATVAQRVPLELGGRTSTRVVVDGYQPGPDERVWAYYNVIGSDYFRTVGTTVIAGREFTPADDEHTEPVVVVNRRMAETYWPGRSAVGGRLRVGDTWCRVVGIVADTKFIRIDEEPLRLMYFPILQRPRTGMTVHLRSDGDPASLEAALRHIVRELDPALPLFGVRTLASSVAVGTWQLRMGSHLLGAFGALALLLASAGLLGVLGRETARRGREMGIRMAVGGSPGRIFRTVVGEGVLLAVSGLLVGFVIAGAVAHLLGSMLFGVGALDPLVFVAVSLFVVVTAAISSAIPAWLAHRLDPVRVLRAE